MIKRSIKWVCVLTVLLLTVGYGILPGQAAVPHLINYQGQITDKSGNPLDGAFNLTFRIYDVAQAGAVLWEENQSVVIGKGIFSVLLGSVTSFSSLAFDKPYFLEIIVGTEVMSPRQAMSSVGYALRAEVANAVDSANTSSIIPPGTVVAYAGATAPAGWLLCDGTAVGRTTYAALYAAIGTAHGTGNGSTTFNIPDYRGRFLRGINDGALPARDPDNATRTAMNPGGNLGNLVGSIQGHEFNSHTHSTTFPRYSDGFSGGGFSANNYYWGDVTYTSDAKGGNETRPVNAYVNYIIKY